MSVCLAPAGINELQALKAKDCGLESEQMEKMGHVPSFA